MIMRCERQHPAISGHSSIAGERPHILKAAIQGNCWSGLVLAATCQKLTAHPLNSVGIFYILKAGVYYSPEFENYEHYDRTYGESGIATPVGEFSVRQFDSMLFEMFENVRPVGHRPPYAANDPASEYHVIIEPRIERFAANIETFSMGQLTARIDYRFKLYLPDGTSLATWNISASDTGERSGWDSGVNFYGERTKALVQKSSNQFIRPNPGIPAFSKMVN